MAFSSSAPLYLDPPEWNQYQQAQQQGRGDRIGSGGAGGGGGGSGSVGHEIHQLQQGQALPRPDGGMQLQGLVRPASMADRARLAKLPQPEQALKCPRCDSINTKFCYFNNYSLSQPRHFCKTCRRYWTRGGALRNIPVGGGCRRNKRSKSTGSGTPSKSQATASTDLNSSSTSTMASNSSLSMIHSAPHLPFMASLQLQPMAGADYTTTNVGLNFAGLNQAMDGRDYQVGGISSSSGMQQWRIQQIQQFPFFGGLDNSASAPVQGLFSFDGDHVGGVASSAGLISQMASVKMEDSVQGLNLRGQYLGAHRNEQYNWSGGSNVGGDGGSNGGGSGAGWMTNLSGFNPSSSGSLL